MGTKTKEIVKSTTEFIPIDLKKIETIKLKLSAIKQVKNDNELAICESTIKEAKSTYKEVMNSRLAFTRQLDEMKEQSMTFEKGLKTAFEPKEQLSSSYLAEKERLRLLAVAKLEKEAKEKADAIAKKAAQEQAYIAFELNTKTKIDVCKGVRELNVVEKTLIEYQPKEDTFGERLNDAIKLKKELLKLVEAKKTDKNFVIDVAAVEQKMEVAIEKELVAAETVDLQAQAKLHNLGTTSGIKKTWTFKIIDVKQVPIDFLMVDQTKVNAMIKAGTREIAGLEIFQEISRSGK